MSSQNKIKSWGFIYVTVGFGLVMTLFGFIVSLGIITGELSMSPTKSFYSGVILSIGIALLWLGLRELNRS